MRVVLSERILCNYPQMEEYLWATACHSKQLDNQVTLMGLYVSVRSHKPLYWAGAAHPYEQTHFRDQLLIHPAGRITMSIGPRVAWRNIIGLFAHELRHIAQFHRGRKQYGYLTDCFLPERQVEPDARAFEDEVKKLVGKQRRYHGNEPLASG